MLRNRNYLFLWFVTAVTTLGIELFYVTFLVVIFEQTDSTLLAAGTSVARLLPSFLLGPLAGVLVDRFPRKYVLIAMDAIRLGLVIFAVLLLHEGGDVPVLGIYLILAGLSAAEVFHRPSRLSLIPSLVSRDELVHANSLILVSTQIVLAVSYTIGGWLILVLSLEQIALSIISLFVLAIISAGLITVPKLKPRDAKERESIWRAFISGWTYLHKHPIVRPVTIMETLEHLPHGVWTGAIMLAFTTQALNGDTVGWGHQLSSYFGGMIIGSLLAMTMNHWLYHHLGRIIVANAFISSFVTLAYALSPNVPSAIFIAFVFGAPFAIREVAHESLLQGTVDVEQLGRVYATREMLRNTAFMFGGVFFAWLSEQFPIRDLYVVGGIMYLMIGLYAISNRALRQSKVILVPETNVV